MAKTPRISTETIRQLAAEGLSFKEIAQATQMNVQTLHSRCYKNGISIPQHAGASKRWAKIYATARAKPWMKTRELAEECLCSKSLIANALRRYGTTLPQLRKEVMMRAVQP